MMRDSRVQTGEWKFSFGLWSLSFLTILGVSCGLFPQKQLQSWKGVHREELIQVMGTPTRATALPNGGQRLEYIQRVTQHPLGGQVYGSTYECHKIFALDSKEVIQTVSETGC